MRHFSVKRLAGFDSLQEHLAALPARRLDFHHGRLEGVLAVAEVDEADVVARRLLLDDVLDVPFEDDFLESGELVSLLVVRPDRELLWGLLEVKVVRLGDDLQGADFVDNDVAAENVTRGVGVLCRHDGLLRNIIKHDQISGFSVFQ